MVGSDFLKFFDKCWVVDIESSKSGERLGCHVWSSTLDPHPWCLREEKQTYEQDDSPSELNGNGDAVRARVVTILCSIIDDRCEQQTDCNGELVATDDRSTNPFRRSLSEHTQLCSKRGIS